MQCFGEWGYTDGFVELSSKWTTKQEKADQLKTFFNLKLKMIKCYFLFYQKGMNLQVHFAIAGDTIIFRAKGVQSVSAYAVVFFLIFFLFSSTSVGPITRT